MKKTIILVIIFIIFLISCNVNPTAPENESLTTANNYRSSFPILGNAYLWVVTTPTSISLNFGDGTTPDAGKGEIIFSTDAQNQITNTMLLTDKYTNNYAFQTGTVTGSLEVLDKTRIKVYFTQNVTPYVKIMEAVCETTP
ncbi:hypothetical protein NEI02_03960 [Brachyspira pilosicoli]|uniref:Uncharacterized protein n=1 Tax=Brachyspira pilosicoli TaxID=52584 RepID=A0AAJ6GAR7_BRAPL|nr:hypothetical protein [Brachyspira pilosicoli]WIH91122.1 hypothetical protein NEI02_03960 [Brachyspira pilosicoli]WIH93413.1 hypothetical protein NEI01_03960 [Brachyspira pilosicoli]WIH95703.1 hypothetical protein NEH99_03955 [Brachyspira pilosicoli]